MGTIVSYNILKPECAPRVNKGDAGADLRVRDSFEVLPGQTVKVPLGVSFEIPSEGVFVQLSARSSVALQGVYCHIGTIDHTFNGKEVCAIVTNFSNDPAWFETGERIVQAVVLEHGSVCYTKKVIEDKGSKDGFGSSGKY